MARRIDADRWEVPAGDSSPLVVRSFVRPDARRHLMIDGGRPAPDSAVRELLETVRADTTEDLVLEADEGDQDLRSVAGAAGFHTDRTELTVEISLDVERLGRLRRLTSGHDIALIGAADADLPRLRALDEAVREDIPGAAGWRWSPEDFAWETFGPDFDPATYLVAVEPESAEYVGLIRIWMKADGPAFGCLGVRREWRGTRVAAALVAAACGTLVQRAHRSVRATVDDANRSVLGVIGRSEYRVVARTLELIHRRT